MSYNKPMIERLNKIPPQEMARRNEEALEINLLVDELMEQDKNISAQAASEKIIAEREISDLDREQFGKGWGEKMLREVLAIHPAVKQVEKAPKETDEQRKTDAFVDFEKGKLGVQFTFAGFEERGANDLKNKFKSVLEKETVTYYGKKEVPLTMLRNNEQKFLEAFSSWEADGRKGSLVDYLPNKDILANESIKTMAMVLEHKYKINRNPINQEWAKYLFDIYNKRQKELETAKKR